MKPSVLHGISSSFLPYCTHWSAEVRSGDILKSNSVYTSIQPKYIQLVNFGVSLWETAVYFCGELVGCLWAVSIHIKCQNHVKYPDLAMFSHIWPWLNLSLEIKCKHIHAKWMHISMCQHWQYYWILVCNHVLHLHSSCTHIQAQSF